VVIYGCFALLARHVIAVQDIIWIFTQRGTFNRKTDALNFLEEKGNLLSLVFFRSENGRSLRWWV